MTGAQPPSSDPPRGLGAARAAVSHGAHRLGDLEHRLEDRIEQGIGRGLERADRSLARRFGGGAVRLLHRTLKVLGVAALATYFAFALLVLLTRYWVLPRIDQWRPQIERSAAQALGVPITIGRIDAGWQTLNPTLALDDVQVADGRGAAALTLPRIEATLSWTTLLVGQPRLVALQAFSPELDVRRLADGRWAVGGFVLDAARPEGGSGLLDWLFAQRLVTISDARVRYHDERAGADAQPLDLRDVQLRLEGGIGTQRIALRAVPPPALAAPIDLRAALRRLPFQRASDFRQWRGEWFAQIDRVDLAALVRLTDLPLDLTHGVGAVRAWARFEAGALVRLTSDLAVADVAVRFAPTLEPLQVATAQGRLGVRRPDGSGVVTEELRLDGLRFVTAAGLNVPPTDLLVRQTAATADRPARTEVAASSVDLPALALLSGHLPLAPELRARVARHALRGTLADVTASWDGPAEEARRYALKGRFSGLAVAAQPAAAEGGAVPGQPGIENLDGTLELTEAGGRMQVAARNAGFDLPGVLAPSQIAFDTLDATLHWTRSDGLVTVAVDSLAAANRDLEVSASGTWQQQASGPGALDLRGRIARADLAAVPRYLPVALDQGLRRWLGAALLDGRALDGTVRVRGDLARFPFRDAANGEFRIAARMTNGALDFAPALDGASQGRPGALWPVLTGIEGSLLFEREKMDITATRASSLGMRIGATTARIPNLGTGAPQLEVRGQATGPLDALVRYANASPVAGWTGGVLRGAQARGNARLDLDLSIPLARVEATRVAGSVTLQNNDLALGGGLPALTRASGVIGFTEKSVLSTGVNATALGGPVRLEAGTRADGAQLFSANGTALLTAVRRQFDDPAAARLFDRATGSARYTAALTLLDGTHDLRVDSDLNGVALDLPAPLRKSATDALPLRIEQQQAADGAEQIRVTLGRALNARVERSRSGDVMQLQRAGIGINEPAVLPSAGLGVNLNVARFDVAAWRALLGGDTARAAATATPAAAAGGGSALTLDALALRTRELVVSGRTFSDVTLAATRASDTWNATVASDLVAGAVTWHQPGAGQTGGRITARLSRLALPTSGHDDPVALLDASTLEIPAIEVTADSFEIDTRRLGRLELVAVNSGSGATAAWRVQKLEVTNPDGRLSATGQWSRERDAAPATPRRMALAFTLDASDVGALLGRLGMAGVVRGGSGRLAGDIGWRGAPYSLDFATLSGKLTLAVDKGQFIKADPGAARLLSVLSLQSLARGLSDSRDLFAQGFSFDVVRADASIEHGVLATRNFKMVGPAATVLIDGTTDLRTETQNLRVAILPDINAGSASLALALANPAIGLGTFLAQLVLKDPLSRAFSREFDVGGSWSEPQVKRLGAG